MDSKQNRRGGAILREWLMLFLGAAICASAVFFFMMPSNLAIASISGLAILIAKFIPLSVSTLTFILNGICLLLAFFFLGKEFSGKTIIMSLFFPAVIAFWEKLFPHFTSIMGDPFLDMICYLFVVSLGIAILFTRNASTGGIDIVTMILNKYFRIDMGRAMTVAGMMISVSALFIYDAKTGVLSILGTYLNGMVLDHFLFGMNAKKKVCILSEQYREIRDFVINDLHSGATLYEAVGALNYEKSTELVAIVNKSEYPKLMDFVERLDPKAFITIYNVNEVKYRPKPILNRKA